MSVENIKTQIAGLKSLVDLAEREGVKLSDYKVRASSVRARRALHQLAQSTRQLRQDLLSEKKSIPTKTKVRLPHRQAMHTPLPAEQTVDEPVEKQLDKPVLARQPAIVDLQIDPPPEEKKKGRGRPRKVNEQLHN